MNIPVPHDEHNHNQLLQMLDEPGTWLIRGGPTASWKAPQARCAQRLRDHVTYRCKATLPDLSSECRMTA